MGHRSIEETPLAVTTVKATEKAQQEEGARAVFTLYSVPVECQKNENRRGRDLPPQSLTEYCLHSIYKTSSGLMATVLHHRKLCVHSLRACPGPYAFTT